MKSEWRVSSNYINEEKHYIAYRLHDVNAINHSGNREYAGEYTTNRDAAVAVAEQLNREEIK